MACRRLYEDVQPCTIKSSEIPSCAPCYSSFVVLRHPRLVGNSQPCAFRSRSHVLHATYKHVVSTWVYGISATLRISVEISVVYTEKQRYHAASLRQSNKPTGTVRSWVPVRPIMDHPAVCFFSEPSNLSAGMQNPDRARDKLFHATSLPGVHVHRFARRTDPGTSEWSSAEHKRPHIIMGFNIAILWKAPTVNPINQKARSIPLLNPLNVYGRVFFFSWYAFPPLLSDAIKADLHLSTTEISNSNIIALTATLLVRLIAGPACDRFGPRYTFAATLLIGAIPTFLSGTAYTPGELYALRFFIGILGGSFVPCQVWTTGFFDKNVVGTANSLTAGFGNAGGGITYFVMPAIYYSLLDRGLTSHVAWRVSFVVPGIIIVAVALALVFLCPDSPTGKWADRIQAAENNLRKHGVSGTVVDIPGAISDKQGLSGSAESASGISDEEKKLDNTRGVFSSEEAQLGEQQMIDTARGEVIQKPSFGEIFRVCMSPQVIVTGACYFCTFGAELSINSILGNYYTANLKPLNLGVTTPGNWAAMFGLMNIVCRPLGGLLSDLVYKSTGSIWSKKILLHTYGVITGVFLLAIGLTNPKDLYTLVLLVGIGLAFFLEGANGLNYSLVPHVHPYANGVVSGFTGACGNFGGIIFAIIFRYSGGYPTGTPDYSKAIWIIGAIVIGVNVCVSWIPPIPKGQIGGR
nr:nitrate transporter [Quercus suber]